MDDIVAQRIVCLLFKGRHHDTPTGIIYSGGTLQHHTLFASSMMGTGSPFSSMTFWVMSANHCETWTISVEVLRLYTIAILKLLIGTLDTWGQVQWTHYLTHPTKVLDTWGQVQWTHYLTHPTKVLDTWGQVQWTNDLIHPTSNQINS